MKLTKKEKIRVKVGIKLPASISVMSEELQRRNRRRKLLYEVSIPPEIRAEAKDILDR